MNYKRSDAAVSLDLEVPATEHCNCLPLSALHTVPSQEQEEDALDSEEVTPATQELNATIRVQLAALFPRSTPLSLLLLHVSQLESMHITPQSSILRRCQRYHAPASFLEQVLVNARRSIRSSDQLLVHEGIGAAIIFPGADQQGMHDIVERIYRSVSLLQAETVIPPLERETVIVMGIGSYPEPAASLERLLCQVGVTVRKFILRPAIIPQWEGTQSTPLHTVEAMEHHLQGKRDATKRSQVLTTVPFMKLPTQLPRRLKQLIPHRIAFELRCAPVGRDHHCLTVAMADPSDSAAISRLREMTGLTIFPVSCDVSALNTLLAHKW